MHAILEICRYIPELQLLNIKGFDDFNFWRDTGAVLNVFNRVLGVRSWRQAVNVSE